jgi:hypothetical protein
MNMLTKHHRPLASILVVTVAVLMLMPVAALAISIGDMIKVLGIGAVVSAFGGQINDFINKALGERDAAAMGATKVVPIISVGRGGFIGAAQVVGVPEQVRRVQAVVQVELGFGSVGGKGLLPISTKKADKNFKPVPGVGVSAVLDFRI